MAGLNDVSPVSRKFNSQSLAKPNGNCPNASPTSMLSGGLAVKEMQAVESASAQLRPSLGWGTLHFCPAAAPPRTGLVPSRPPKMYIPSAASLHTAVWWARPSGAVPLEMATSDHVAAWLVAGNRVLDPGLEMFASTSSARNPRKFRTKTEFWKRHGIKRCIACHLGFSVRMVNVRFFTSWFHEVSWNVMSNFVLGGFHLSTLQAWPMKC